MAEKNDHYKYDPSVAAAVIFVVGFTISGLYHAFQIFKLKSYYFIPFFIGCVVEIIGYGARAVNATEPSGEWTQGPYIIQALLLLLGPPFYAVSIYMILGRLMRLLGAEHYSIIRTKWLTKFFLLGDVASILGQGMGGGMLAGADSKASRDRGQMIIIIGLAIQIIFFGLFMVVTIIFHRRIYREPTNASLKMVSPWNKLLVVLYGTSGLIMIRSLFRVIEYVMGEDGVLMSKEVFIYLFDATLMLVVSIAFNVFHPSRIIKNEKRQPIRSSDSENQFETYALDRPSTGGHR
ncbi:RTA1 like protein-domain-containing protein [Ilyonectria robusta]|uniref:RTA1 like protein-domain-containing protein n=1 Tax=Ilyonectria robusta TaxID=1079257 RepID=UPI001E8D6AE8|nr:RTA1 like protein-domain-containing protein [Ilyonectria robusta]KAH6982450.1 RTA1 like protein-domain-containing protein [Ilyonectria destructans]KAH8661789.1 RTA1 like protein-domain-containing protein [Ilyonectria robusta]